MFFLSHVRLVSDLHGWMEMSWDNPAVNICASKSENSWLDEQTNRYFQLSFGWTDIWMNSWLLNITCWSGNTSLASCVNDHMIGQSWMAGWWCNNHLEKWLFVRQWVSDDPNHMMENNPFMFRSTDQLGRTSWFLGRITSCKSMVNIPWPHGRLYRGMPPYGIMVSLDWQEMWIWDGSFPPLR